jgi:RNA polymerase sigma factor (sigma-70 family)
MDTRTLESDVLLARDGDEAAFRRLVEVSGNTVCSIALAIVRNVQASEDIAQEAFLAAWANMKKLRNPASFLPWLRQVTRNQAHLWRRAHERELADEDAVAAVIDARPSPADAVLAAEEQRVLTEVLDELPDDAREVLILYYREERSSKHVAALLGISEDAVRQRVSRGRGLLREQMLERFGRTVARTAPGGAFAAAVAGALTMTAPTASAAAAFASGATSAAIAKASLLGGALGWFGVLMGMRELEPVFDEREGRELRRFRNVVLAVVSAGCVIITLSAKTAMGLLVSVQSVYLAIGLLYGIWLPKILDRRMEWEKSIDPEMAKQNRRQWMWATISRAAAAAIGGAVIMAMIVMTS